MRSWRGQSIALLLLAMLPSLALSGGVTVHTLSGEAGGLADHLDKSKWNVLMVYTTYCTICRRQYPIISEFHAKHAQTDAVVLGISLDGDAERDKVSAYREKMAHTFPSVTADAAQFGDLYERATGETFTGTPTYLVFDNKGGLHAYLDGPITLSALESFLSQ